MKIPMFNEMSEASKSLEKAREIIEDTGGKSEQLNKTADILFNPFASFNPDLQGVSKVEVIQDIAELRSPEILNTRISMSLLDEKLTKLTWDKASAFERNEMMQKMFDIMMEEMQIPDQVRKNLSLLQTGTDSVEGNLVVSGKCNRFIGKNEFGKFVVTEKPTVEMHYALMYQEYETALGALYNQALRVMQQSCCLEPEGTYRDAAERAKWVEEVEDQIEGKVTQNSAMNMFAVSAERDMMTKFNKLAKTKGIMNRQISFK